MNAVAISNNDIVHFHWHVQEKIFTAWCSIRFAMTGRPSIKNPCRP
jgi:hypothetical protein